MKILRAKVSKNDKIAKIETELACKISEKIQPLVKMAQTE